jgi:hypothetical protein
MAHHNSPESQTHCPACELGPFIRNHYFTGKLMLERDFTEEQRYYIDKLRHHHQRLHGWGVVCGLQVKAHPNPECQDKFICIEPGTAIDCCGHEIVVRELDYVDIRTLPALKDLADKHDTAAHTLQVCIRYRECPTEEIPVLYDECGCDDTRCAPNRILESYEIDVIVDPSTPKGAAEASIAPGEPHPCDEIFWRHLEGCPHCDGPNCVILATIERYHLGYKIEDQTDPPSKPEDDEKAHIARIDNRKGRHLLPSTSVLVDIIRCILENCCQPSEPKPPPNYFSTWLVLGPVFDPQHQTAGHYDGDDHPMAGPIIDAISEDSNRRQLNPDNLSNLDNIGSGPLAGDIVEYELKVQDNNKNKTWTFPKMKYPWRVRNFKGVMWTNIHDIENNIHNQLPGDEADDPFDPANYFNFFGKDHALAFFLVYINSVNEQNLDTTLWIRSDDSVRVWLNGSEIEGLKYVGERDIRDDTETGAPVTIMPGNNIILIAVSETHVEWGLSAHLENDKGLRFFVHNPKRERQKRKSQFEYVSIIGEADNWKKNDPDRMLFCEGDGLWRGRIRLTHEQFKFFLKGTGNNERYYPEETNLDPPRLPGVYEIIFNENVLWDSNLKPHLLLVKPFKPEFE